MKASVLRECASSTCYHCGLPAVPAFATEIKGELKDFCCGGCAAVSGFIQESGLGSYYQYRDQLPLETPQAEVPNLDIYDDLEYQQGFVESLEGEDIKRARIHIEGMNCSACAWLVEKRLIQQKGVVSARVNYSQRLLFLEWHWSQASLSQLLELVQKLGFMVTPDRPQQRKQTQQKEGRELLLRLGVAGIGMMQVGMYAIASYMAGGVDGAALPTAAENVGMTEGTRGLLRYASMVLATLVIFYSAQPFFAGAMRSIKSWHLSMDVPVALALGLSYSSSLVAVWQGKGEVYFDAVCMFTFFLLVSRYMEFRARSLWTADRDRSTSDQAILIEKGENQRFVASNSLRPGQTILVKSGDVLPVDGELLEKQAELDLAQLTGEFKPQILSQGDELSSGSINLGGPIQLRVLRTQDQSAMARIESIVSQAEMHRPRIASLADQLAGYFVVVLITLALGTFTFWWFRDSSQAFWIALSVLVVGCPCALSLATPTALTVLMRNLSKQGVLVQRPESLEVLSKIDRILFDKTGTLTEGRYQLAEVEVYGDVSENECIRLATLLESFSNHPLSKAFECIVDELNEVSGWADFPGRGVEASINGQLYRIGTRQFVDEISSDSLRAHRESEGMQSIYLGSSKGLLASFVVCDQLRHEAVSALQSLREKLPNVELGLCSGDPSPEVGIVADRLGISDWQDSMTPEAKYRRLKQYQQRGEKVLAVGDGINDAPLLSAADASIALSSAVDLSKNKADFVLLSNNLAAIPLLVDNARRARKIISENLGWALGYNLLAIPLAMAGMVPPWMAALGMSASSAIVVLNAFRARVRDHKITGSVRLQVQTC